MNFESRRCRRRDDAGVRVAYIKSLSPKTALTPAEQTQFAAAWSALQKKSQKKPPKKTTAKGKKPAQSHPR